MILFTADFLKNRGYDIKYEFDDIDKYLEYCEEMQENVKEDFNSKKLLSEVLEDIALFGYSELYIFFTIKKIQGFEILYIYDYADLEYKVKDTAENFAKIKTECLLKLLNFQIQKSTS